MIVNNKQARALVVDGATGLVILKPGINEMTDADFAIAKGGFESAGLIKSGKLEIGPSKEEKVGSTIVSVGKSLKDITDLEKVQQIIDATLDADLLNTWRKAEKREEVRLFIMNQLDVIKTGKKPEGEDA